jgi:hypothetical protein
LLEGRIADDVCLLSSALASAQSIRNLISPSLLQAAFLRNFHLASASEPTEEPHYNITPMDLIGYPGGGGGRFAR